MINSPSLVLSDFEAVAWQNAIVPASEPTCWCYHNLFRLRSEKSHADVEEKASALFLKLAIWTTPHLNNEEALPFPEAVLDAITEEDFALLRELAPTALDAELRARLADLAWQGRVANKRDPDMARLAVSSYLEASKCFADKWYEESQRIERALNLAFGLGYKAAEQEAVWKHTEEKLHHINGEDDWFLSARLMELMQEHGRGDEAMYAPMAERAALRAEGQRGTGQWDKARRYWEIKAAWHKTNSEEWFEALQRGAETHAFEAQDEIDGFYERQDLIAAAMHLQQAIEAYRNIIPHDRFQARIDELHRRMIEVNSQAQQQFESHEYTINISEYSREAADQVKDRSFSAAIRELVQMYASPPLETLRDQVERGTCELSELLCAHQQVNSAGQVIARRPSLLSPDPQQQAKAVEAEMFNVSGQYRSLVAQAMLYPALRQMQQDHLVTMRDWIGLIHHSPFVPTDREWLFARGFQAGWNGDWDVATHLLVPQIENSVRHILTRNGYLASALHSTGTQSEQGLDQTLEKPELKGILSEALIFDLRGLLTEQTGDYLRHKTCHGLVSFAHFYSSPSVYLWWLSLRLCLLPLLAMSAADQSTPDATNVGESSATDQNDSPLIDPSTSNAA